MLANTPSSPEAGAATADNENLRHTDEALLALRLSVIKDEVLPSLVEGPSFAALNNWQRSTVKVLHESLEADQTVDLPTRTGKSHLIRRLATAGVESGVRTAIIAPRRHILAEHQSELTSQGVPTNYLELGPAAEPGDQTIPAVQLISAQRLAVNLTTESTQAENIDLVLIDEGHRALGTKTIAGITPREDEARSRSRIFVIWC